MARTIIWSGYTWDVRNQGVSEPGPNRWSDSAANVTVDGSDLVLSIVKDEQGRWASSEVDNQQHLGYGTYRWIVDTDLSKIDADDVVGMFTWGGGTPSNNEIDIEAAHWGNRAWPSGSGTVWQDFAADENVSKSFDYSDRPPYVNQFTWTPGRVHYLVTDATGAKLFDWTVTSGMPKPTSEIPMVNFWRFEGSAPAAPRSVRFSSFSWVPLGHEDELPDPRTPGGGVAPPPVAGCARAGGATAGGLFAPIERLAMRPRRFAVRGHRRGTTIRWRAATAGRLHITVRRRLRRHGLVTVGGIHRSVPAGSGRLRFTGRIEGRRLTPGTYRLVAWLRSAAADGRCAPKRLRFRVIGR